MALAYDPHDGIEVPFYDGAGGGKLMPKAAGPDDLQTLGHKGAEALPTPMGMIVNSAIMGYYLK